MLYSYVELHPILPSCTFPRKFLQQIPDAAELDILKNCEEVSKFLQNEDSVKASLDMVRTAFDTLIADYPIMKKYLAANAEIIQDKHEKSDEEAEEDDRDELDDEIEYAQRLSADPLPIMHGGRILWQGEPR